MLTLSSNTWSLLMGKFNSNFICEFNVKVNDLVLSA
jgi:hypothetical protein